MGENSEKGGMFKGKSHDDGGIPITVEETGQKIEVEGKEPLIPEEISDDPNVYEMEGTNRQVLNKILSKVGAKNLSEKATEVHAGDMIICVRSAHDTSKHKYKGTMKEIVSKVNESGGCNVIEQGGQQVYKYGGKTYTLKDGEEYHHGGEMLGLMPLTSSKYKYEGGGTVDSLQTDLNYMINESWFDFSQDLDDVKEATRELHQDITGSSIDKETNEELEEDNGWTVLQKVWVNIQEKAKTLNQNQVDDIYKKWGENLQERYKKGGMTATKKTIPNSIQKRIDLANQYIAWAMENDVRGETDFGSTWTYILKFTKLIEVKNQFVYLEYDLPYDNKTSKERFNVNNETAVEDLRYNISAIIRSVKKGAKDEGMEAPKFESGGSIDWTPEAEAKGTQIELEHQDTIEKLQTEDITPQEGANLIAQDHLKENPDYYQQPMNMGDAKNMTEFLNESDEYIMTCDGCKNFDMSTLERFGLDKPLYYIMAKDELHSFELMSPKEYLEKIAKGFNLSYEVVTTGNAVYPPKIAEFVRLMQEGEKFPVPYYTVNGKNQEGRHRALAAMEMGYELIPVVSIRRLSDEEVNIWARKFKHSSFEDVSEYFQSNGYNGITRLGYDNLKSHIQYRLADGGAIDSEPSTEEEAAEMLRSLMPRNKFNYMYDRLNKVAPDLIPLLNTAKEPYDVHGKSQYRTDDFGGNDAYMHLSIQGLEKVREGVYDIAISHYYKQQGDMMCDPCMTIRMDTQLHTVEALTFRMDGLGGGRVLEVYPSQYKGKMINMAQKNSQNSFLNKWTSNLVKQGHKVEFDTLPTEEIDIKVGDVVKRLSGGTIRYKVMDIKDSTFNAVDTVNGMTWTGFKLDEFEKVGEEEAKMELERLDNARPTGEKLAKIIANLKEKYPIVIEYHEGTGDYDLTGYKTLEDYQEALRKIGFTGDGEKLYTKVMTHIIGAGRNTVYLSKQEEDLDPYTGDVEEYLNKYIKQMDYSPLREDKSPSSEFQGISLNHKEQEIVDKAVAKIEATEKPDTARLLQTKVINHLKEKRNKSRSQENKARLMNIIGVLEIQHMLEYGSEPAKKPSPEVIEWKEAVDALTENMDSGSKKDQKEWKTAIAILKDYMGYEGHPYGSFKEGGKVVNDKVYAAILEEAKADKAWAIEKEKEVGREWKGASKISQDMLKNRLDKSEEELAKEKYEYFKMRAFAQNSYGQPIDPNAKEKWETLSGDIIPDWNNPEGKKIEKPVLEDDLPFAEGGETAKYLDEYEQSSSEEISKDAKSIQEWVYSQKWSEDDGTLAAERETRVKSFEDKHGVKVKSGKMEDGGNVPDVVQQVIDFNDDQYGGMADVSHRESNGKINIEIRTDNGGMRDAFFHEFKELGTADYHDELVDDPDEGDDEFYAYITVYNFKEGGKSDSHSTEFTRLSNLSQRNRNALNMKFIHLPLTEIHQAQLDYLKSLSDEEYSQLQQLENGGELPNVINESGQYLNISGTKDNLIITLTDEGREEVESLREDDRTDWEIVPELFEDIRANSELDWHDDLGESGLGMTSASGITDGYHYTDDGAYTTEADDARLYYFNDYALRSPIDDMLTPEGLVLTGFKNNMKDGGSTPDFKIIDNGTGVAKSQRYSTKAYGTIFAAPSEQELIDRVTEQLARINISEEDKENFHEYVETFYGKDGIYKKFFQGVSQDEIKSATNEYITNRPFDWGGGDSMDRERVREIMLENRQKMADGGEYKPLNTVEVIFENPAHNYSTTVSANSTEESSRKYFVGQKFNVGVYPKEEMAEVVDINFIDNSKTPKKEMADGGDTDKKFIDFGNDKCTTQKECVKYLHEKFSDDSYSIKKCKECKNIYHVIVNGETLAKDVRFEKRGNFYHLQIATTLNAEGGETEITHKEGDWVSMFEEEPSLKVTKVHSWVDKGNTYDVESRDGSISRNNISWTKLTKSEEDKSLEDGGNIDDEDTFISWHKNINEARHELGELKKDGVSAVIKTLGHGDHEIHRK